MDAGRVIELLELVREEGCHQHQCMNAAFTARPCDCGWQQVEDATTAMLAELRAEAAYPPVYKIGSVSVERAKELHRDLLAGIASGDIIPAVAIDPSALDRAVGPSDVGEESRHLVLAGDRHQFYSWRQEHPELVRAFCLGNVSDLLRQIQGRPPESLRFHRYGTWRERGDAMDILNRLSERGIQEVKP